MDGCIQDTAPEAVCSSGRYELFCCSCCIASSPISIVSVTSGVGILAGVVAAAGRSYCWFGRRDACALSRHAGTTTAYLQG